MQLRAIGKTFGKVFQLTITALRCVYQIAVMTPSWYEFWSTCLLVWTRHYVILMIRLKGGRFQVVDFL